MFFEAEADIAGEQIIMHIDIGPGELHGRQYEIIKGLLLVEKRIDKCRRLIYI